MSNGVGEFLDGLPEVEKPVVARVPPTTRDGGDIVYMKPGDAIKCSCGAAIVKRKADVYEVTGPMYTRGGWIYCYECPDRIRIEPKVRFTQSPTPKGFSN